MQVQPPRETRRLQIDLSVATGKREGTLTQLRSSWPEEMVVSTNLEVHFGTMKRGILSNQFETERTSFANFYPGGAKADPIAAATAQAIDQAYESFRQLKLETTYGAPEAYEALDRLVIRSGDGFWSFDRNAAPKEALALYQAAAGALAWAKVPSYA